MKIIVADRLSLSLIRRIFSQEDSIISTQRSIPRIDYPFHDRILFGPDSVFARPVTACSCDYGFDFDEDELASELLASSAASLLDQPTFTIPADEFETLYRWFSS